MASVARPDSRSSRWRSSSLEGNPSNDENDKENQPNSHRPHDEKAPKGLGFKSSFPQPTKSIEATSTTQKDYRLQQQQQQLLPVKTPTSASTLRRALRATIQSPPPPALQERQLKPRRLQPNISNNHDSENHISTNEVHKQFAIPGPTSQNGQRINLRETILPLAADRPNLTRKGLGGNDTAVIGAHGGRFTQSLSSMGPPQRVAPKTPNSLLRTELEAFDSDSSSNTGDESLLFSPPPGALWNTLNLADSSSKSVLVRSPSIHQGSGTGDERMILNNSHLGGGHDIRTNVGYSMGLVVVSPQVAEQIHLWSSSKKKSPSDNSILFLGRGDSGSVVAKSHVPGFRSPSDNTESPALPRALLRTPRLVENARPAEKPSLHNEVALDVPKAKEEDPQVTSNLNESIPSLSVDGTIQKTSKGGIEVQLSNPFSSKSSTLAKVPSGTFLRQHGNDEEAKPLSSSMPKALRERLSSNKRTAPRPLTELTVNTSNAALRQHQSGKSRTVATSSKSIARFTARDSIKASTGDTKKVLVVEKKDAEVSDSKNLSTNGGKTRAHENPSTTVPFPGDGHPTTRITEGKRQAGLGNEQANRCLKTDIPFNCRNLDMSSTNSQRTEGDGTSSGKKVIDRTLLGTVHHTGGIAFDVPISSPTTAKRNVTAGTPKIQSSIQDTVPKQIEEAEADDWFNRQSPTFLSWLNYTFNPSDDETHSESVGSETVSGLRSLLVYRRLSHVRTKAFTLFQDESMRQIRSRLIQEIARGRLAIRSDHDVTADVRLREQLASLLLSYTLPWLRMGLEATFCESIDPVPLSAKSPKTYYGRLRVSLESFIHKRVLSDSKTLEKFTKGRCNVPSGIFETKYKAQMRALVLSRVMILVFFLDQAKDANILDNFPRLFTISSDVKSSREVLLAICRACLSSEGDIIKHFSRIGLSVSYTQHPVDEVEFKVSNLATDFRDGVLLTRLSEIVTGAPFKSLLTSLRLPAVSRLQKKYNVSFAISKIKDFGIVIDENVDPHHIMDGHRDKVLTLLWCIIAHCCMTKLLQGEHVENEIRAVVRSTKARSKVLGIQRASRTADAHFPLKWSPNGTPEDVLKSLLLRWTQAVCSSYGLSVRDFTHSFADGRIFCCLIHYYHPSSIVLNEILEASQSTDDASGEFVMKEAKSLDSQLACWSKANRFIRELGGIPIMTSTSNTMDPPDEKSILLCLSYLCSRLMESSTEIFATILIQAYYRRYRSRILMKRKFAAASFIFRCWSIHKANYFRARKRRFEAAVAVLEWFVLSNKSGLVRLRCARLERERRTEASIRIQCAFRGKLGRSISLQVRAHAQAAVVVQSGVRIFLAKILLERLQLQRQAATVVQSCVRRHIVRGCFALSKHSALLLQRIMRGYLTRNRLGVQTYAVLVVQQAWWNYVARKEVYSAARKLQSVWRGYLGRALSHQRMVEWNAACLIQKTWRGYYGSLFYAYSIQSVVRMQSSVRGFLARKLFQVAKCKLAAVAIQRMWRGFLSQVKFQMVLFDVICIQTAVRRHLAIAIRARKARAIVSIQCAMRVSMASRRMSLKADLRQIERNRYSAAVLIQSIARRNLTIQKSMSMNAAVIRIQCQWRRFLWKQLKMYCAQKIQTFYRSRNARLYFLALKHAVVELQRCWRGSVCRQVLANHHFAATIIQSTWRQSVAKAQLFFLSEQKKAVIVIQAFIRGTSIRLRLNGMHYSASVIQAQWNMYSWNKRAAASATKLQSYFRLRLSRASFVYTRNSAVRVQTFYRSYMSRQALRSLRQEAAAIQVQKVWRSFSQQVQFQLDRFDIICVQSVVRRHLTLLENTKRDIAAVVVQCGVRCAHARQALSLRRCRRSVAVKDAATKIQSLYRVWAKRNTFFALMTSVITLQKWWRGVAVRKSFVHLSVASAIIQRKWRKHYEDVMTRRAILHGKSAALIQSLVRGFLSKHKFQQTIRSLIWLQCSFRIRIARRKLLVAKQLKHEEMMRKVASVRIQAEVRRMVTFKRYSILIQSARRVQHQWRAFTLLKRRKFSAVRIQAVFRLCLAKSRFDVLKVAVGTVQRCWRGHSTRREIQNRNIAAISIQSNWRRFWAQSYFLLYLLETNSAVLIQSTFRMYVVRMDYLVVKFATDTIQRYTRGYLTRIDNEIKHFAATEIQRLWRGFRMPSLVSMVASAILIQSTMRMARSRWEVQRLKVAFWTEFFYRNRKASVIQSAYRMYRRREKEDQAARIIQGFFRFYSQLRRIQLVSRGMIHMQALFRGVTVRQRRNKRLVQVAQRLKVESDRAIENPFLRLGNRTDRALYILETSQSLTKIMDAVKELEASTRLSVVCCQVFTKANAADILLHLIQSCNRSVPHMELKEHILLTLENVAQFPSLVGSFAHYKYAEVFLDNIQVFRDKDGIFCLAVTLLDRISKADPAVAKFCAAHEHLKRLKEVYRVVGRRRSQNPTLQLPSKGMKKPWKARGLTKQDEFDRDSSTKVLGELIDTFASIESLTRTTNNVDSVYEF